MQALTGNLEAPFVNGVSTFTDIQFSGIGDGLVMRFTGNGSSLVASSNFAVMSIDHEAVSFVAGLSTLLFVHNMSPTMIAGAKPSNATTPRVRAKDCWANTASLCSAGMSTSVTGVDCGDGSIDCISPGPLPVCYNGSRSLPGHQVFKTGTWNLIFALSSLMWGQIQSTLIAVQVTSGPIASIDMVSQQTDTLMDEKMIPVPALSANDAYANRIIGCTGAGVTTTKIVANLDRPLISGAGLKGITHSTPFLCPQWHCERWYRRVCFHLNR